MNTTYASKINPQFSNAGVQDVTPDLSGVEKGFDVMIKENENELKALQNIAQDQAQIEFNRGAAELVDKYGTDFKGLDKALLKLENDLYGRIKPTEPVMAEDLLRQNDATRLRAVEQARKNYQRDINIRIKNTSGTMLDGTEANAEGDFLIYLGEVSTKQPDERKPENIMPFLKDLEQHNAILARKDMDGNPIFTDTQIASRKGMKGVRMNAAYRYIDGMTLDQLQNFYNTTFQSEQWDKDTGFNVDDKHKLESRIKTRIKDLKSDEGKAIKVRAVQDTANLINNGGDMVAINELKKSGFIPEKLIDETSKTSNTIIENNWYDPKNKSDPTGLLKIYSDLNTLIKETDDSPDAQLNRIEKYTQLIDGVASKLKELNMPTETYKEYLGDISKSIVDKEFQSNLLPIVDYAKQVTTGDEDIDKITGKGNKLEKLFQSEEKQGDYSLLGKRKAKRNATIYVAEQFPYMLNYARTGDREGLANLLNSTKYEQVKIENSYWIPQDTFDVLEAKYRKGEKPLYYHNGHVLEYNGISNGSALFKTII